MNRQRIEELCLNLCIGPNDLVQFLVDKRRELAANKLYEYFQTKSIDEITRWIAAIDQMIIEDGPDGGKKSEPEPSQNQKRRTRRAKQTDTEPEKSQ